MFRDSYVLCITFYEHSMYVSHICIMSMVQYEHNNTPYNNHWMSDTNDNDNIRNNNYKNKNRKIISFNPPLCKLSNINMGKYF